MALSDLSKRASELELSMRLDIESVKIAKKEMDLFIRDQAHAAVECFFNKTGLTPSSISINMVEVTSISDKKRMCKVVEVNSFVQL